MNTDKVISMLQAATDRLDDELMELESAGVINSRDYFYHCERRAEIPGADVWAYAEELRMMREFRAAHRG